MPQKRLPGRAWLRQRTPSSLTWAHSPASSSASSSSMSMLSTGASGSPVKLALLMSMCQPVRRAARRAFCPSLPMARESWSSGTTTVA